MQKIARQISLSKRFLALLALAMLLGMPSATAWAQRPEGGRFGGFGGDSVGLLSQKSVQEELKLSDEQRTKATQLAEKQREGFQDFRNLSRDERQKKFEERTAANRTAVAAILDPAQVKRLRQISLQQQGARALADSEVADALQLSSEQKQKIKTVLDDSGDKAREAFQGGREGAREKMEALRKSSLDSAAAVLTDEQKSKWKELVGEPFTGEIRRPEFRGGGNRRQNN
jgi:hypothetical protein